MGVLGASGNALYCGLVSVTPIPDTAPNGLSSRPRWGRFFVRRTNEGQSGAVEVDRRLTPGISRKL